MQRGRLTTAIAQATGVAPNDLATLEHVEQAGPISPKELAERLLLTPGSITALLDRLEAAGWVRRVRHPTSRRSLLVELAPGAEQASQAVGVDMFEADIEKAARRLSPAGREAVAQFLDAAAAAAELHTRRLGPGLM